MTAVSETIVREYFELNGFLVRQFRKHVAPAGREDDDIDFLVLNAKPNTRTDDRPFLLASPDLGSIERAVVIVKAWHTHIFSPALLTNNPDFFLFLERKSFHQAVARFGRSGTLIKILVVTALQHDSLTREQWIAIL